MSEFLSEEEALAAAERVRLEVLAWKVLQGSRVRVAYVDSRWRVYVGKGFPILNAVDFEHARWLTWNLLAVVDTTGVPHKLEQKNWRKDQMPVEERASLFANWSVSEERFNNEPPDGTIQPLIEFGRACENLSPPKRDIVGRDFNGRPFRSQV